MPAGRAAGRRAWRRGVRSPARTRRRERGPGPPAGDEAWRLDAGSGGTLESLALVPSPEAERELQPGEVRVAVRAAGVNFRDVLIALGMYPGAAMIGGEGAGVVLEVGAGVEDLAPGDRVMGLLGGGFGRSRSATAARSRGYPRGGRSRRRRRCRLSS